MIEWLREQALLWDNIVDPGFEFRAVLAFISYLERTDASPWVSVEERLPVSAEPVAAATLRMWMRLSYFDREWHHFSDGLWLFWGAPVTHWMPLPRV